MLQRIVQANGVVTYQSPLLREIGVRHAFSTRIGGVSPAPFDSLNLGNPTGCARLDEDGNLRDNYRRLQEAIGAAGALRCWVQQVHGHAVGMVRPEGEGEYAEPLEAEVRDRWNGQTQADAVLTDQANLLLTIRVADCVPVLLASLDGNVVAAVHAGWRGVVAGVIIETLRAMREAGVEASDVVAAIGPGISAENFEVGEEVAQEFVRVGLGNAVRGFQGGRKPHVDLQAAISHQLTAAGVRAIDANACCTMRDAADFFSHRRDNGVTGRMAAVIMRRGQ